MEKQSANGNQNLWREKFMRQADTTPYPADPGFPAVGKDMGARPSWLTQRVKAEMFAVMKMMADLRLNTVCLGASCPNIGECYGDRRATFLILGRVCTRNCRFCDITKGEPEKVDPAEPARLSVAVRQLGLRHVVITSVTRDDLEDGGARHFARCVETVRRACPGVTIEVLVPDFLGDAKAVDTVLAAAPEVFNHNVETVPGLYPSVRPEADYRRSLAVLERAVRRGRGQVKTGLMLGMGEEEGQVLQVMEELAKIGVTFLTLGQYLSPTAGHWPVAQYVTPESFQHWRGIALQMGFPKVAAGPLIRSSYDAAAMYRKSLPASVRHV
jgi:lipoic acid synthetase